MRSAAALRDLDERRLLATGRLAARSGTALQARDFATRRLRKLATRVAQGGQQLEYAEAAQLHALRIAAKKLRYSAEFFAGLYGKNTAVSFLAVLGKVQDVLGQINDIAVAHRLLDTLAAEGAAQQEPNIIEAVNLSKGWIAHDLSDLIGALKANMRRFNKQAVFWEKY